jgi:hypothetical protein
MRVSAASKQSPNILSTGDPGRLFQVTIGHPAQSASEASEGITHSLRPTPCWTPHERRRAVRPQRPGWALERETEHERDVKVLPRCYRTEPSPAGLAGRECAEKYRKYEGLRLVRAFGSVIVGFVLGCALGAAGQAAYGPWSVCIPAELGLLAVGMSSME